jgi:hypothetical protein
LASYIQTPTELARASLFPSGDRQLVYPAASKHGELRYPVGVVGRSVLRPCPTNETAWINPATISTAPMPSNIFRLMIARSFNRKWRQIG